MNPQLLSKFDDLLSSLFSDEKSVEKSIDDQSVGEPLQTFTRNGFTRLFILQFYSSSQKLPLRFEESIENIICEGRIACNAEVILKQKGHVTPVDWRLKGRSPIATQSFVH